MGRKIPSADGRYHSRLFRIRDRSKKVMFCGHHRLMSWGSACASFLTDKIDRWWRVDLFWKLPLNEFFKSSAIYLRSCSSRLKRSALQEVFLLERAGQSARSCWKIIQYSNWDKRCNEMIGRTDFLRHYWSTSVIIIFFQNAISQKKGNM